MSDLVFILGMPNNNSWNGRWSGEGRLYAIFDKIQNTKKGRVRADLLLKKGRWYYSFGDGWGASVHVKEMNGADLRAAKKSCQGFCGYDWMVDSIRYYGNIYGPAKPKPEDLEAGFWTRLAKEPPHE